MATVLVYLRCAMLVLVPLTMTAKILVGTLQSIVGWHRTNYGGAAAYLQHIGFDEKEQERLKLSLSSP